MGLWLEANIHEPCHILILLLCLGIPYALNAKTFLNIWMEFLLLGIVVCKFW